MKVLCSLFFCLNALALNFGAAEKDWWENGNFYQIYPRSFMDSNGDGIGDLNGITSRLTHFRDIGMDAVWLSPINRSPMADFGYDISDYREIHPDYGTLGDFENLLQRAHELGIRVILDFVPNHTSDEHEWFEKSVNGDPEYRDYYVWHDGVVNASTGVRQPPSNWFALFSGSTWEWNDVRQQYYLHQFGIKQPDLNFRNPVVVQAMKDVMTYWLEKGIDGFRIDAVAFILESEVDPKTGTYPDDGYLGPPEDWYHYDHRNTFALHESNEFIFQWRELVDNWKRDHGGDTKIILTEAYTSLEDVLRMYGNSARKGSHVPFNFQMVEHIDNRSTAADYDFRVNSWLDNMPEGVYANWLLGNHDRNRLATRFGVQRTDLINIFLQTLPGISNIYYGEEIGMEDVFVSWEEGVDVQGCIVGPDLYMTRTRDPFRTPMLWDDSSNGGFSTASSTWLPVGEAYVENNVAAQWAAENSHLKIFKRVVELRKAEAAFQDGGYEPKVIENMLIYRRNAEEGDAFIVVLNIGDVDEVLDLTKLYDNVGSKVQVELSSLQSGIPNGQIVGAESFTAFAYNAYVLRVIGDE